MFQFITLFLPSVSRFASLSLSVLPLGTESFLGGTSAIYHATPCKCTALFHSYTPFSCSGFSCGRPALLNLTAMATSWCFTQLQTVWNLYKCGGADLTGWGFLWNANFPCMCCDWARVPYAIPIWKGNGTTKIRLATVLHPLLPSLWIQQEMPEAETALWLFFDSSNRWFPMEQVSLLICPSPAFFFSFN